MRAIVAVDEKWGIGKNNALLFEVPEDMKFFRETTLGKVIVVGRKTLESFPGGRPLKNRVNVVLSSKLNEVEGAVVVNDIDALMREIGHFPPNDVFVCGGESVYRALLPYCDEALVTKIFADGSAGAFFPNLDEVQNWELAETSPEKESNGYKFTFCKYINKKVKN